MPEIQIPTAISGVITKLPEIGFCMDGATHIIHSVTGSTRLAGSNRTAIKQLGDNADGKTKVTVMGYPVWGPECMHLSVYSVEPMSDWIGRIDALKGK